MRTLTGLAILIGMTGAASADDRALTSQDVQAKLRPMSSDIERCYLDRTTDVRGAGHLALVLTVSKHGILEQVTVQTPGIAPKIAKQVDGCIRGVISAVAFPAKHVSTTATVPYYFQRTPGPGPALSCWDPNGCHSK